VARPREIRAIAEAVSKPTISHNAKQRPKCEADLSTAWLGTGHAGASDSVCSRSPVLHLGDVYTDRPRDLGRRQEAEDNLVVKVPLLPVGRASTMQRSRATDLGGSGISPNNLENTELEEELRKIKERGATAKEELQRRYKQRRAKLREQQHEKKKSSPVAKLTGSRPRPSPIDAIT